MQQSENRVERALQRAIMDAGSQGCPPRLANALEYAVFPGGHRVRPKLCLAVAVANGDSDPALSETAAVAIELLHCASLVHDDLPCFDNAEFRRGKPSVHRAFEERIAVLTGDALIVAAFKILAEASIRAAHPERLGDLIQIISSAVAAPNGICAGQAWECESAIDLVQYHRAKTGALFVAATCAGAAAAGVTHAPWAALGQGIGESFQVADDINDVTENPETTGKPGGQDAHLGRPNAVDQMGIQGATRRLKALVSDSVSSIPACSGRDFLQSLVLEEAKRFFPRSLAQQAA